MTCEDFENLMIINIYGKLTSQEKCEFDHHLAECSDCSSKYEQSNIQENIFGNSEPPEPDWERSWDLIAQKSIKRKRTFEFSFQKYALATAFVILVFIIGFSVGRNLLVTQPEYHISSASGFSDLSLQDFAEDLEPILIDFLNRSDQPIPKEFAKLERKIVSELLIKTKLLKYIMQKRENTQLVQLLGNIEFILLNLSNLRPEDSLSTKQIQKFIREKNLKVQLKLVANEKIII
jgi:hypothetical protein